MTRTLTVHRGGPHLTVQDHGRPGYLAQGLSQGGAADRLALAEGAALLGQPADTAAVEMAGHGGTFEASEDARIALTGARMRADIDGKPLIWNASHMLPASARLTIGGSLEGAYGYLHVGGGINTHALLTSRSTHLAAGLGQPLTDGDRLPLGPDARPGDAGFALNPAPRHAGGTIRIVPSLQTDLFPAFERTRFEATTFQRDTRANRMGARLIPDGDGFASDTGLSVLSEIIVPGDIQITGDGTPFVLLAECQTTGGYPRIGTIIPADLPLVVQADRGAKLRFQFIDIREAVAIERTEAKARANLPRKRTRMIRRPEDMTDLLDYELISGVTSGGDLIQD